MTQRRLIINLIPLLDVLAIMIFGILIQSHHMTRRGLEQKHQEFDRMVESERQRAARAERSLKASGDLVKNLQGDLRQQADRSSANRTEITQLEDRLRAMAEELASARAQASEEDRKRAQERALARVRESVQFAQSLQTTFDLNEEQTKQAMEAMPQSDADRKKMLDEMKRLQQTPRERLGPAMKEASEFSKRNDTVTLFVQSDGTVVVSTLDGAEIGRIADYHSPEEVQVQLNEALKRFTGNKNFLYLLLSWDNVLLEKWRMVARGATGQVEYLKIRPDNDGKRYFLVMVGFAPK